MRSRRLVLLATLFFILLFTFTPLSKVSASPKSISPELQDAFSRLNSLSGEMTEVATELKEKIDEFEASKPVDPGKVFILHNPNAYQQSTWTTQQLEDAQAALDNAFNKIDPLYEEMQVVSAEIATLLDDPALPGALLTKHRAFIAEYEKTYEELSALYEGVRLSQMDLMPTNSIVALNRTSLDKDMTAKNVIESNVNKIIKKLGMTKTEEGTTFEAKRPPVGENITMKPREPEVGGTHVPLYLAPQQSIQSEGSATQSSGRQLLLSAQGGAGAPLAPVADDYTQTIDTEMIQELTDLAASLNHDPVKIYEWVRNNIYCSAKGAGKTYFDRAGNDFDTASLLIALFRESGIPCRYVYGTVRLDPGQAQMFGAESAVISAAIFARGGIPVEWDGFDLLIEHAWVEAYVPYDNYRGVKGSSGAYAWIPLDPSFKRYATTEGMQVAEASITDWQAFWSEFFKNGVTDYTALDLYKEKIEEYVTANYPGKTIDDVPITRAIIPLTQGILPVSLPYEVESVHSDYSEIPDNLRHKAKFGVNMGDPDEQIIVTIPTVTLACKRLTLQWLGATDADQDIIDYFGGLYNTPVYLVGVKPAILLDGVIIAEGSEASAQLGHISCTSSLPIGVNIDTTNIKSYDPYVLRSMHLPISRYETIAVGYSFNGFSDEYMQKQMDTLQANQQSLNYDEVFGQIAYINIVSWYNRTYEAAGEACGLRHVAYYPILWSFGIAKIKNDINSLMGGVAGVSAKSFSTDAISLHSMTPLHGENVWIDLSMVMGATGSQLEGFVYRDLYGFPPVSAVTLVRGRRNGSQLLDRRLDV
jgi:hypothetical protein